MTTTGFKYERERCPHCTADVASNRYVQHLKAAHPELATDGAARCEALGCPKCGSLDAGVVDTRPEVRGVRRRRECGQCGNRWSTMEVLTSRVGIGGLDRQKVDEAAAVLAAFRTLYEAMTQAGVTHDN